MRRSRLRIWRPARSSLFVIARSKATKQSILPLRSGMDCFALLAMTAERRRTRQSVIPERDRAERLQQLLVELAAHLFHHGKRIGMRELEPVGTLLHQRRIDIHDRGQAV